MNVEYQKGIVISDGSKKIILDPETPHTPIGIPSFITHAHSDHTKGLNGGADSYLTPATYDLYKQVYHKPSKNIHTLEFHEPVEINGFEVELIPAGHLLGAAQVLIRHGNETVQYTGDFCLESLLCVQKALIPKESVDLLITEATYGDRNIAIESRMNVRLKILQYAIQELKLKRIPVFNIGHVGGAQELIKFFNQVSPQTVVVVDEKIAVASTIYQKYGVELFYTPVNNFQPIGTFILLVSRATKQLPAFMNSYSYTRGIVTGQSARFNFSKYDFTAALTTHATYEELIQLATAVAPQKILTHYGHPEKLAIDLREVHEIDALPLSQLTEAFVVSQHITTRQPILKDMSLDDFRYLLED